ncbi:NACHT domain-containing protein [Streptomyces roseoverticillatus]|uniref:NACHT domain-containing protein n=1 Tax=Streptomyces roseoverticillatus TaxID=66429 RepID=UPI0027E480D2|nr:NACHT domain-containing protein [Streptomyces roseoverticillatus]MCF3100560.1 NACHT domain-containing protein [Streptomyces roseoverticillatus]
MAVLGARQGSGVLLRPELVLTSAHLFEKGDAVEVAAPNGDGRVPCDVVWSGDPKTCDVALLVARRPVLSFRHAAPLRWGKCAGWQPMPRCQVLGFPQVQRYGPGELEAVQVPGTLMPLSGRMRGRYVLHADHHPPGPVPDGSPWAGLSGGPVFAGPLLIGIASGDPMGWQHSSVESVPLSAVIDDAGFRKALLEHWPDAPDFEEVTSAYPEDLIYEPAYAKAVKAAYSRLEIFGLDELGPGDWDLDTAYFSLEAQSPCPTDPEPPGLPEATGVPAPQGTLDSPGIPDPPDAPEPSDVPEPRRIEDLLGSRPRTVLRGEAGAGKTTLVWWLASHAVCRTLPEQLAELDGLIPFVVPMRSLAARGITSPTPSQLPKIARLPVDRPPDGWAGRVLEAGRGLLLVDGMDEIPQADRELARKWLAGLLRMYPRTRCLVTVRPLAVGSDWLDQEGFEELRLLPMGDEDIRSFAAAWHRAARLECDRYADEHWAKRQRDRLDKLEPELGQEFERNAVLRDLARTPLLCAVICALHRQWNGLLPKTRWDLYSAALNLMLARRDAHRRILKPEGIELTADESRQLLQRIAVWLVRNGRAELSREQAVRQLGLALRGLRRVRAQGATPVVLTYLLNRSGLLQEQAPDSIQFIHRTFQDYLAAKELQESDCLDELLLHAAEEQWQDVLRLAVGHCGRSEEKRLIAGLTAAADAAPDRETEWPLRALAAHCALNAKYIEDDQYQQVWAGLKRLLPSRNQRELHSLGQDVVAAMVTAVRS